METTRGVHGSWEPKDGYPPYIQIPRVLVVSLETDIRLKLPFSDSDRCQHLQRMPFKCHKNERRGTR